MKPKYIKRADLSSMLTGGLVAAPIGALLGGGSASMVKRPEETKEERRRRILNQAILGTALATPAGAALSGVIKPELLSAFTKTPPGAWETSGRRHTISGLLGAGVGGWRALKGKTDSTLGSLKKLVGKHVTDPTSKSMWYADELINQNKTGKRGLQTWDPKAYLRAWRSGRISGGQMAKHFGKSTGAPLAAAILTALLANEAGKAGGNLTDFIKGRGLITN